MRVGEAGLDGTTSGFFFGGMVGKELEVDLNEDHEVDEDESSACAPYLACQMSSLRSWIPGVKDTPFLGSARGAKEARRHLPREYLAKFFRLTCKQATQGHREFT